MSHIPAPLRRLVHERARGCCEYCLIPEAYTLASHEVDHIIAQKHGGPTEAHNLALSCALCNQHKGSDLSSIDPGSGELVPLYHPRRDRWSDHFDLQDGCIAARTPAGQATIRLLWMNHPDRILERQLLIAAGVLHSPTSDINP